MKTFFSAKDIKSEIDYTYLEKLNQRLKDIVMTINDAVDKTIRVNNIDLFCNEYIDKVFKALKENDILPRLNNQGRRPEEVYYSWMRGNIMAIFFTKAISMIFGINENEIRVIGKDNIDEIESFSRQPTADLELFLDGKTIRVEMQSGYQGVNDIKQHKVREAKNQFEEKGIHSIIIHFDLYNGQVAFVNISRIQENDINWITRQQMEGQTVFNINQDYFIWQITENYPAIADINECIFD
ncbi:MAG: hypothetical protein FWE47_04475 [Oscillospiraceae bacterium]|nr:hypothetical protein [Oscillospiraceae bacterium]